MKTLREMMDLVESAQAGVAEGSNDTIYPNAEVIKSRNGKPVGEIYQDAHGWGCFHYKADNGADSIESREEALEWLKDIAEEYRQDRSLREQGVAEAKSDDPDYDETLKRFKKGLPPKKKQDVAEEQLEETTPDAMAKIDDLFRK